MAIIGGLQFGNRTPTDSTVFGQRLFGFNPVFSQFFNNQPRPKPKTAVQQAIENSIAGSNTGTTTDTAGGLNQTTDLSSTVTNQQNVVNPTQDLTATGGLNQTTTLPDNVVTQQDTVLPQQDVTTTGGLNQTSNVTTASGTAGTNTGTTTINPPAVGTIEMDPTIGTWAQIAGVGTGFNYDPFTYNDINSLGAQYGYEDYLRGITPYNETIKGPSQNTLYMGYGGTNLVQQGLSGTNQVNKLNTYTPFTYTDTATQSAVDALNKALEGALYTTTYTGGMGSSGFGSTPTKTLNYGRIDPELKALIRGNDIEIGRSGISMLDALNDKQRDAVLAKVSAKTGIPADQLTKLYNDYHYANKTFFDPSGAGWADLMSSGAAEDVLSGIKSWSGAGANIDEANALLAREGVAKQFTDKDFGVTAENPVKEITDSSGNKFYAVFDKDTGTQFIARDRESADKIAAGNSGYTFDEETGMFYGQKDRGEYIDAAYYYLNKPDEKGKPTDINRLLTVDDFLPAGVTIRTATPEQLASAQATLDGQRELMKTWKDPYAFTKDVAKTYDINKYNLTEDSDPLKKKGRYFFVNDETGEVVSVKNKNVATWAADDVANDTPLFYKGKYYYIDKDDGSIRSTKSEFIANGESATENYLNIRDWRKLLPAGVTEATATPEQIAQAQSDLATLQQNLIDLTGEGTVFNLFKSEKLPIPEDFYYDPERITRQFNTLVNMGIDPKTIDPKLTPENVYKKSLEYDAPDSGFGGFIGGVILPALSIAYPQLAPILQGLSGAYQLSQGNIMGALTSFAGATGFMKEIFGGEGVLGGFKNSLTNTLQSNFGLSADVAKNLVDTGVWAGGSAVVAALNDQNVLEALARGAGEQYLRNTISSYLSSSIPNDSVRNFITQRLTDTTMNALQGGNVNFEQLLTNAFATGLFSDMSSKTRASNP